MVLPRPTPSASKRRKRIMRMARSTGTRGDSRGSTGPGRGTTVRLLMRAVSSCAGRVCILFLAGALAGAVQGAQFPMSRQFLRYAAPLAVADFDSDGRLDWMAAGPSATGGMTNAVFRNLGGLAFERRGVELPEIIYGTSQVADFDNDGDPDLARGGWMNGFGYQTQVLRNDAGALTALGDPVAGQIAVWADLNNDGTTDMVTVDNSEHGARIWWGDGRGHVAASDQEVASRVSEAGALDCDGDGDLDLLVRSGSPASTVLCLNNGLGQFIETGVTVSIGPPSAASCGDFNRDGVLDLLEGIRTGQGNNNRVLKPHLLLGDGGFQFAPAFPGEGSLAGGQAVLADLDNDDRVDLLLAGTDTSSGGQWLTPGSRVFFQAAGVGLSAPVYLSQTQNDVAAGAADLDGDGDLDLIIGGSDDSSGATWAVRIHQNTTTNRSSVPPPPQALAATPAASSVLLAWAPEAAAAPGCTYNLRVGTQSGGQDVFSAVASPAGTRRLSGLGNTQTALRRRLRALAPGTYYWSVQTVNAAFAASAFAPEATFAITGIETNTPPTLSAIPNQTTSEDVPAPPIAFAVGDAETAPGALELSVASSDPQLVALSQVQIGGSGTNRVLNILPSANQFGTTRITVTASDEGGLGASTGFVLTVLPVDDPPSISPIPSQAAYVGGPPITIALSYADAETPKANLTLAVRSADERLIPPAGLKLTPSFSTPTLTVTPATNRVGSTTVTVTVSDGSLTASTAFVVTIAPLPFAAEPTALETLGSASLSVADADNDHDLDLLVAALDPADTSRGSVRLYRNDGAGQFASGDFIALPALTSVRAAWADCDRDGDLDLALCGWATNRPLTCILRNDGNSTFTNLAVPLAGVYNGTIEWGDFDGDGLPDLLFAGSTATGSSVRLYRNLDGRQFANVVLPQPDFQPSAAAAADFDGDGRLDFALSGYDAVNQAVTRLYRQTSAGFVPTNTKLDRFARDLGWCDLDGDGDLDLWMLVIASEGSVVTGSLEVFLNDGQGGLAAPTAFPDVGTGGAWGDYDADGDPDYVASGSNTGRSRWGSLNPDGSPSAILLRNDGSETLGSGGAVLGTHSFGRAVSADFDGDGRVDLVGTAGSRGWSSGSPSVTTPQPIVLFRNVNGRINPTPSAPHNLAAQVAPSGVTLRWDPPADDNQANGHTYNVRVGTQPGACDVVAPTARQDGFVRLPAAGNAGLRTAYTLADLTGETYYWSVQAVDASFAGSTFAPERSFVIAHADNRPPSFGDLPPQTTPEETAIEILIPVQDDRTPAASLQLEAFSSDPSLVPYTGLTTVWTGTNWTLRVLPAANLTGVADIALVASDAPGLRTTNRLNLTVTPVNDPPAISAIPPQTVAFGIASPPIAFAIGDVETPPEQLTLSASSDNPTLVPPENVAFEGTGTQRTLTITAARGAPGYATLTIAVRDADGAVASTHFEVTVKTQTFSAIANPFARFRGDTAAWGDYDGDSRLDLLIAGDAGTALTRLYHNDGEDLFSDSGIRLAAARGGAARWGDLDNDGDLDLLLTGSYDAAGVHVYRNEGPDGFVRLDLTTSGYNWYFAAWVDYDNDGRLDIALAGEYPNNFFYNPVARLYHNDGNGRFTSSPVSLPQRDGPVAGADFDRDGWTDLLLGGTDRNAMTFLAMMLHNNEQGAAFAPTTIASGFTRVGSQTADLDGDGWLDVLTSEHSPTVTTLYRNRGDGSFTPWLAPLPLTGSVAVGDANNDGWPDVFVAGYGHDFMLGLTNGTQLFLSTAGANFVPADLAFPRFDIAGPAVWGDADNDNDLDLLLVGQLEGGDYAARLYRNDLDTANAPPIAPANLRANVLGDTLDLSWDEASDPNQVAALTYNVRIGTRPGSGDILSPMSAPDGSRLLPAPGNAGTCRFKTTARVILGRTYYWTVQAVDNAFVGSPFAPEAAYYASHPPTLDPIDDLTALEDVPTAPILLTIGDADDPADSLTLDAACSDPAATFAFGGAGAHRTLVLEPAPNAFGTNTVTVTVRDPWGTTTSRSFRWVVAPANDPPVARSQTVTLIEDATASFVLDATDIDGDPLEFTILQPPRFGVLGAPARAMTYTPATDFFGEDSFRYQASDGQSRSSATTVRLVVMPAPDTLEQRIAVTLMPDGDVWLGLEGEPWQRYRIDASPDLVVWIPLLELEGARGPVRFRDLVAGTVPMRFYRAVALP